MTDRDSVRYRLTLLLYRVQERVAITPAESKVITIVGLLFLLGLGAGEVRRMRSANAFDYSALDSMFAEAATHYSAGRSRPAARDSISQSTRNDTTATSPVTKQQRREAATPPAGARVNLNTATQAQLQRLPRIGPALAQRIVEYRSRHGLFRAVQELTRVRGIGAKTMALLDPLITVDDTTRATPR